MGELIKVNGKVINIKPKKDKFLLNEINDLIGSYVHPMFNYDNWIFINNYTPLDDINYNKKASKKLNVDIWGDCLIINNDELLPTFLISEDFFKIIDTIMFKYIEEFNKFFQDLDEELIEDEENEDDDDIVNLIEIEHIGNEMNDELVQQKKVAFLMEEAYKNLIDLNISFKDINKHFIIYRSNVKSIEINNNLKERVSFLHKLSDFFINKEEYEKCKKINILKNYIENNM